MPLPAPPAGNDCSTHAEPELWTERALERRTEHETEHEL